MSSAGMANSPMGAMDRAMSAANQTIQDHGDLSPTQLESLLEHLSSAFTGLIQYLSGAKEISVQEIADFRKDFNDIQSSFVDLASSKAVGINGIGAESAEATSNYDRKAKNISFDPPKLLLETLNNPKQGDKSLKQIESELKKFLKSLKEGKMSIGDINHLLATLTDLYKETLTSQKLAAYPESDLRTLHQTLGGLTEQSKADNWGQVDLLDLLDPQEKKKRKELMELIRKLMEYLEKLISAVLVEVGNLKSKEGVM